MGSPDPMSCAQSIMSRVPTDDPPRPVKPWVDGEVAGRETSKNRGFLLNGPLLPDDLWLSRENSSGVRLPISTVEPRRATTGRHAFSARLWPAVAYSGRVFANSSVTH